MDGKLIAFGGPRDPRLREEEGTLEESTEHTGATQGGGTFAVPEIPEATQGGGTFSRDGREATLAVSA